jgi:hypothetical protein
MKGTERKWAAWSGVVAALSLAAALVFNGVQVHDSAVAQRQAKLASELSLMTQLQDAMNESVYSRVQFTRQFQQLRAGKRSSLTPTAYRVMAEEAANMDYFAWLFNSGFLSANGADELWGPRMICEYKRAFAPALLNPAQDLPELLQFIESRGPKLSHLGERC